MTRLAPSRRELLLLLCAVTVAVLLGVLLAAVINLRADFQEQKDTADARATQRDRLAQDVDALRDQLLALGQTPKVGPAPTPAERGERGERGLAGRDGQTIVGPPGPPGRMPSPIPGPPGRDGRDGADSTAPGPKGDKGDKGDPGSPASPAPSHFTCTPREGDPRTFDCEAAEPSPTPTPTPTPSPVSPGSST
jgi:cell division protein FtsB